MPWGIKGWNIHNSTHAPLSLLVSLEAMLQDSAEAVRGATRSSFEFVLRKDSKGWRKEHFHLAVIFYTYILFTNQSIEYSVDRYIFLVFSNSRNWSFLAWLSTPCRCLFAECHKSVSLRDRRSNARQIRVLIKERNVNVGDYCSEWVWRFSIAENYCILGSKTHLQKGSINMKFAVHFPMEYDFLRMPDAVKPPTL